VGAGVGDLCGGTTPPFTIQPRLWWPEYEASVNTDLLCFSTTKFRPGKGFLITLVMTSVA
jgi:hypothetical protein